MTDVMASNAWQVDIVQLKRVKATVRLATKAFVSDDVATLFALGFSHARIRELRAQRRLPIIVYCAEHANDQLPTKKGIGACSLTTCR